VFFSAGVRAGDVKEKVSDVNWDVALHVVFADKAALDTYQKDPRHLKFIDENKDSWSEVRVFDSELTDYTLGKKGKAGTTTPGDKPAGSLRQLEKEMRRLKEQQEAVRQRLEMQIRELEKKGGE
jgi:stress responsive alpha/beta barrel protein